MTLVNLTPHDVNFCSASGEVFLTIPPSGEVARVSEIRVHVGDMDIGDACIPINKVKFGEVVGLPEPKSSVVFITSSKVRDACPNRHDILVPDEYVRDAQGKIIGCQALA